MWVNVENAVDDAVHELLVDREAWLDLWEEGPEVIPVEEIAPESEAERRLEARAVSQKVGDDLGVGLTARPLQAGDIVAVSWGEIPDHAFRRTSPAVERDDRPFADLDDVVVTCSALTVGVWDGEGPADFFC